MPHIALRSPTETLDADAAAALLAYVARRGAVRSALDFGVGREALAKAAARMPIRRGTALLIRAGLSLAAAEARS